MSKEKIKKLEEELTDKDYELQSYADNEYLLKEEIKYLKEEIKHLKRKNKLTNKNK